MLQFVTLLHIACNSCLSP